jgi:hypothetical protein
VCGTGDYCEDGQCTDACWSTDYNRSLVCGNSPHNSSVSCGTCVGDTTQCGWDQLGCYPENGSYCGGGTWCDSSHSYCYDKCSSLSESQNPEIRCCNHYVSDYVHRESGHIENYLGCGVCCNGETDTLGVWADGYVGCCPQGYPWPTTQNSQRLCSQSKAGESNVKAR